MLRRGGRSAEVGLPRAVALMPAAARTSLAIAVSIALLGAPDRARAEDPPPERSARLIVRFREGTSAGERSALLARAGLRSRRRLRIARAHVAELVGGASRAHTLERLLASELVEAAEPDVELHPHAIALDDPDLPSLWGLRDIRAPQAWERSAGASSSVIAVIDSGVDYRHPDLAPNLWLNPGEIANGIDDDANGYVDDLHGIDCITGSGDPLDDQGHGTSVAGAIAAVGANGIGVVGVAWRARIMALKFLPRTGTAYASDAIECLDYATSMRKRGIDVRVTNNSWGGTAYSQELRRAIERAADAGLLFVASAGNSARDLDAIPSYPAAYDLPSVVTVAAVDSAGLAGFSNYGAARVDLAAPGVSIYSTALGGGYAFFEGSSMAAPHVAGTAALIFALHPGATPAAVRDLLLGSTRPVPGLQQRVASGGKLDADAAACAPGSGSLRIEPGDGFARARGSLLTLHARLRSCPGRVIGAAVSATPAGGAAFPLRDDGATPDTAANDGVYSGLWRLDAIGPAALAVRAQFGSRTLEAAIAGQVVAANAPDSDADQVPDALDDCPWYPSAIQGDLDRNGLGDACECGDATRDGTVDIADLLAVNRSVFNASPASPLCDIDGDGACTIADSIAIHRKIYGAALFCPRHPAPRP